MSDAQRWLHHRAFYRPQGEPIPLPADADGAERAAWLRVWLPRLTRPLRHPGNYRYAWPLDRRVSLPVGAPYPKSLSA